MFFRTIRWRIAIPYLLLILTAMGVLSLLVQRVVRNNALEDLQARLVTGALAVAETTEPVLSEGADDEAVDSLARRWSELLDMRITIVGPEGVVLGESHEERRLMENHLQRPEIQEALVTGEGDAIRQSATLGQEMAYTALRLEEDDALLGIVRVAVPVAVVEDEIGQLRSTIFSATLLTTFFATLLGLAVAERTARPVRRLTAVARRMADGDLSARLLVTSRDEVGTLTQAFNEMGEQLREKVSTLAEERARLAMVLDLMADGVLIVDESGRVQLINPAAAELLETRTSEALGRTFAQVARHHQLIEMWQRCLRTSTEQTETVEISHADLFLQVIMTPLGTGHPGSLIIIQNLTPIRRLETVRRDFISNISHELRTPLAALKAVVDTLRDAAVDDPEAARYFLDRADYEVDALSQMVQELLELSRIESGKAPLRLEPTTVSHVVLPTLERLQPQIERQRLTVELDLPDELPPVLMDAGRIQQVMLNLVHNAIKFTPPQGTISVRARERDGMVEVQVRDTGPGIPPGDLDRIFERFYKTDRARSSGGTGLGLAIARHLVQAHGGEIWARSHSQGGSSFYFTLPIAESARTAADA
ncbi:MAG: ATP-binding protein [Candidatus Promineifilaceae bacterium]|nr:ATP-binding protein [Candidatus Promineifilaceae bacterium]